MAEGGTRKGGIGSDLRFGDKAHQMSKDARVLQKRLLLLIHRGAWPYYAAIAFVAFVFWLIHML
jgi:hypothetical protein